MSTSVSAKLYALSTAPTEPVSAECDTHGPYTVNVLVVDGEPLPPDCPRCLRRSLDELDSEERKALQEVQRKSKRQQRLDAIELPPTLMDKRYADYDVSVDPTAAQQLQGCRKFGDNWEENRQNGSNLVLCGRPGTGKTMLAAIVCKQIASTHDSQPLYTTVSQLLRHIRGSFNKNAGYTELQAMKRFYLADLLVIDEVGVKLSTDFDRATLFEIIDLRYQRDLPTIIISNLTLDEISEHSSERMVDRLTQKGTLLTFEWESYRGRTS